MKEGIGRFCNSLLDYIAIRATSIFSGQPEIRGLIGIRGDTSDADVKSEG